MEDSNEEELPEDDPVDDVVRFYRMHIETVKMINKRQCCSV
jgi:hypothetical protein